MYEIKPDFVNIEIIFEEYLKLPIWICWKEIPPSEAEIEKAKTLMREAKPVKMPINPHDGSQAKTNDKTTWGTYQEAKDYYNANLSVLAGLGLNYYGMSDHNTYLLPIDLDSIKNEAGEIKPTVKYIIQTLNSFTELTPSGKGCRIYVKMNKSEVLKGGRKAGVLVRKDNLGEEIERQSMEFFGEGNHYVTVTGVFLYLEDLGLIFKEIKVRTRKEIDEIYKQVFPQKIKKEEVKEKDVEITESFLAEELDNAGQIYQEEFTVDQDKNPGIKFKIICPWGSEENTAHASGVNNLGDAFIFVPEDHRRPWFSCSHATCKNKYSWEDYCKKVFGYVLASSSFHKDIEAWVNEHPGTTFDHRFLHNEFHIFSAKEKSNLRKVLIRLKEENKIEEIVEKAGYYRVVSSKIIIMTLKKYEKKVFDISMPLGIGKLGTFKPERIILNQGDVGAGKSAFAFSIIPLNYGKVRIVFLSNSEIDEDDIAERLNWAISEKRPLEYWLNKDNLVFGRINIDTEFSDVIREFKNSILIFDYFDGSKDYTKSAYQMGRIHDRLVDTGNIAIVNVQINPNHDVKDNFDQRGYGGQGLTHRPSTVFNLVKGEGHHLIYVQKFKQFEREIYDYFFDTRYYRRYRVTNDKGLVKTLESEPYWIHDDDTNYKYMDIKEERVKPDHVMGTKRGIE